MLMRSFCLILALKGFLLIDSATNCINQNNFNTSKQLQLAFLLDIYEFQLVLKLERGT